MKEPKYLSCLAFSLFLLLAVTGSLLVQTLGHIASVPLARYALLITLPASALATYGYCFPLTRRHALTAIALGIALGAIGIASGYQLDLSADGLGYQQSAALAILHGWNPFHQQGAMLWQNIYPSGIWAIEASLASLYGSAEATKSLQFWWLFITLPTLYAGLRSYLGERRGHITALVILAAASPVVCSQILTHYVDSMLYMASLTFLGGLLLYGDTLRTKRLSLLIMICATLLIVNIKLSGIYHGAVLCLSAVLFLWHRSRKFPYTIAAALLVTGIIATAVIGYRPYVTSFVQYGPSLFPMSTEEFSGAQRPSTFDDMHSWQRFTYSLFSTSGGEPHKPAELKWPWVVNASELAFMGDPDVRTGGFGPLFALGFLASIGLCALILCKKQPLDKGLLILCAVNLPGSIFFPQSWWMRYVPIAYACPFLLLWALPAQTGKSRAALYAVMAVFAANSIIAGWDSYAQYRKDEIAFDDVITRLRTQPAGSVYIVPPAKNYTIYNHGYESLQRWLTQAGISAPVEIGAPCQNKVAYYAEFLICTRRQN